jgi:hypothetical protein
LSTTGWLFKVLKLEHRSEVTRLEGAVVTHSGFTKIDLDNLGVLAGQETSLGDEPATRTARETVFTLGYPNEYFKRCLHRSHFRLSRGGRHG